MSVITPTAAPPMPAITDLLRCPVTGEMLIADADGLATESGSHRYALSASGVPLFAEAVCSGDARSQKDHYEAIADAYVTNLSYPHTQEYMAYLDRALLATVDPGDLGTIAEICCGHGEAFHLLQGRFDRGVGVDVSPAMLENAVRSHAGASVSFVQGDATMLPLVDGGFDSIFMLGGIHHVRDRSALFGEIFRILRPGGRFYYREPVSDFPPWRAIRAVAYRLAPALDHETERPLLYAETVPVLERAGFITRGWRTHGFLGFCLFMNSDVLVFNRLFRFVPGIRGITRLAAGIDAFTLRLPGLRRAGLQVVGCAEKPRSHAETAVGSAGDIVVTGNTPDTGAGAATSVPIEAGSPDRFGYEWDNYSEIRPEYEEQFRRWSVPLEPEDWKDRSFLDVGCGMGRNSYWPMSYGAKRGVAIDVDERSLASARRTLGPFPAAEVRRLSAYDIDYENEFDIAFSIGVIHHLERPEAALAAMFRAVRPGGRMLIWVYGLENNRWFVWFLTPLRRILFSRLPVGFVHFLSLFPAALVYLGLRLGLGRIEYFRLLRGFTFRHLRSIVFDQMLPQIANYWSKQQVERLMRDAGVVDVQLSWVNEMSWTAVGRKPE